jgi:protein gp37
MAADWWWDKSWNVVGGCKAVSPGCRYCYAAQYAVIKTQPTVKGGGLHYGVAVKKVKKDGTTKYAFTGKTATVLPPFHPRWKWPGRWPGAKHCCLDPDNPEPGQPSLIWFGDMTDIFWEKHDIKVISRAIGTIVQSPHICLIMTKYTLRCQQFFSGLDPAWVRSWQKKVWIGFSAETQPYFDERWFHMRPLARAGWHVYANLAPMLGPITLPRRFLALGKQTWVIVAGEQPSPAPATCRPLKADWARAVRDQCRENNVYFFMKQMAAKQPRPPDLRMREFPTSWVSKRSPRE